jgi:hypothetical protein
VTGTQFHTNNPHISGTTLQKIGHLNDLMPGIWEPLVTSITACTTLLSGYLWWQCQFLFTHSSHNQ